jgi:hypothetical protein
MKTTKDDPMEPSLASCGLRTSSAGMEYIQISMPENGLKTIAQVCSLLTLASPYPSTLS